MNKIRQTIKFTVLICTISFFLISGCKKNENNSKPIELAKKSNIDLMSLTKFIAHSSEVPEYQIVYDSNKKEFIVYGWYHKSLADVEKEYLIATEYKLNLKN